MALRELRICVGQTHQPECHHQQYIADGRRLEQERIANAIIAHCADRTEALVWEGDILAMVWNGILPARFHPRDEEPYIPTAVPVAWYRAIERRSWLRRLLRR